MIPSWLIGLSYILASLRVLPFFLFLAKYRGKLFDPVPLMLRGFAFTGFIQALSSLVILFENPKTFALLRLDPGVLWVTIANQGITTIVAWYLYYVFLRYRRSR